MPVVMGHCNVCRKFRGLQDGRCWYCASGPRQRVAGRIGLCLGCERRLALNSWGTCRQCSREDRQRTPRARAADALCRLVHEPAPLSPGRCVCLAEAMAEGLTDLLASQEGGSP